MLGNEAMEFLKTLNNLDNIWKECDDAEYNDRQLTQFAERYHEHKLKLLNIPPVIGSLDAKQLHSELKAYAKWYQMDEMRRTESERFDTIINRYLEQKD